MNKTFKKILAMLTALTLAMSLFVVAPAMATGGNAQGGGGSVSLWQSLWDETNLIVNGDAESIMEFDDGCNVKSKDGDQLIWKAAENTIGVEITAEQSSNQAYSGTTSILVKKNGPDSNHGVFSPIVYSSGIKANTTYIANMKILGTKKNANEGWATVQNKGTQWENKVSFMGYFGGIFTITGPTKYNTYSLKDLADAPYADADEQGEPLDKSYWKDITATFTTDSNLKEYYGFGIAFQDYNSEFYTDDYYLGELMIADADITSEKTITVPNSGKTSVELTAEAYNQLGTTEGLEDTEFSFELVKNPEGVYISGSTLTVTNNAKAGDIAVKVICEPKYAGAENQTGIYTEYRTQEVALTLNKLSDADYYATLRNSTNILTSSNNPGLEGTIVGNGNIWTSHFYMTSTRNSTYEVKAEQKYNGSNSLLVKVPENAADKESHFPATGATGKVKGKTIVASAMVLGTQANPENCEVSLSMQLAYYLGAPWTKITTTGNSVKLNTMRIAPASGTEGQTTLDSSNWKMVYGSAFCPNTTAAMYNFGAGVVADGKSVEYYVDDYYFGELLVSKVESDTQNKAIVGEDTAVELKAKAYNQLGTDEFFDGETKSTYKWEFISLPNGVTLEDDQLLIDGEAEAGNAVLEVTFEPTFTGADAQTDPTVLARRKTTVVVKIERKPEFEFDDSVEGKVTTTAVVGNLAEDAKAYCAIYKILEDGAKKLMGVESKDIVAGGKNVSFTSIELPDYTYEIKCFMWYENNPMKNVIPAVVWE